MNARLWRPAIEWDANWVDVNCRKKKRNNAANCSSIRPTKKSVRPEKKPRTSATTRALGYRVMAPLPLGGPKPYRIRIIARASHSSWRAAFAAALACEQEALEALPADDPDTHDFLRCSLWIVKPKRAQTEVKDQRKLRTEAPTKPGNSG